MIHVFIGTKAQYIKTAPLLRLMQDKGIEFRLIDSGQHAALSSGLRAELGVREPDLFLGDGTDVVSIPQALTWSAKIAAKLGSGVRVRDEIFDGQPGVCVIHGDTPSTLLSSLLAKRAGLRVAHLEAGLRSGAWWDPFPEEAIRRMVMRTADLLFAPDDVAARHLRSLRLSGRIVQVEANTVVEALDRAEVTVPDVDGRGPAVWTMHRVENLQNNDRVDRFVALLLEAAASGPVRFVIHGPTGITLRKRAHWAVLQEAANVEVVELLPHADFVRSLAAAPYVVTDGGSIQEECALLGVPTVLWRNRTERTDGLGRNVLLSHFDGDVVRRVVADPDRFRVETAPTDQRPSEQILAELLALDTRA